MSWLAVHILVELLIAAGFGGLIGWALRARRVEQPSEKASDMAARLAELQTQLEMKREETQALRTRLSASGGGATQESDAAPETTLSWRNRYLESRVRYLEGRLTDLEAGVASEPSPPPAPPPPPPEAPDETRRLRWRNRYLEGRIRYLEDELVGAGVMSPSGSGSDEGGRKPPDADKPDTLTAPRGGSADDLKEITGIGPKLEKVLNGLGVWHFDQIASWTQKEVDWVNAAINFRSRIEREGWIEQARQLAQGIETEGKRAYHEGRQG